MRTFFLESGQWREPYCIEGQEARHMVKVLRMRNGDKVRLLDGRGREGIFIITQTEKAKVHLSAESVTDHPAPVSSTIVAVGWAKSVRRGWLLEKAVELEAGGVWLWQADRSQGKVPDDLKESWQSQMVAGAKQSGNPWLPELKTIPDGVRGLIELSREIDRTYILWEGQQPSDMLAPEMLGQNGRTLFVVGPEGGFSDNEVSALVDSGFTPVSLGSRILRWETAALLCLGLDWWKRQLGDDNER